MAVPRDLAARASAVALIAALFTLIALLTSRFVLVGHEFAGHGVAAWLVGGEVTDHRLFLFGGGWVMTRTPALTTLEVFAVSMGGILLEVAVAAGLIVIARRARRSLVFRVVATGAAGLCLIHAATYLGLGAHYGYGDGLVLHRELGAALPIVVALACIVATGSAWWLGGRLAQQLAPTLGVASRWGAVAALLVCAALASATHGGLMLAERAVRDDPTYADIMREEAERKAHRAVAREARDRRAEGRPMTAEERRARERSLASRHRRAPIRVPLFVAIALAAMLASLRTRRADVAPTRLKWLHLRGPAIATAVAIGLVALFHAPWWR